MKFYVFRDSSFVRHQDPSTVHTAMVYVVQVCRQLASRIRMELCTYRSGIQFLSNKEYNDSGTQELGNILVVWGKFW